MRAYGIDRPTRDLDLWIARDLANARAMEKFLHRVQNRPPLERLQQPNFRFTVGDPTNPAVDILTSVAGDPEFDACYERRQVLRLDGYELDVISPRDLIGIKEAAAAQNEADAASGTLGVHERQVAEGAARKDRRDVTFIQMWFGLEA